MFRERDESVNRQLLALTQIINDGNDQAVAEAARSEVPRLIAALNELLASHRPDVNGYCPDCGTPRWWRRHRNAPCRTYFAVHLALIGDATRSHARHALR
jgi:hypothetical protein